MKRENPYNTNSNNSRNWCIHSRPDRLVISHFKSNYFRMKSQFLLIILILTLGYKCVSAQTYTENKNILKSYKIYPGTILEINNKYGKIELTTWNKDSVRIEANLSIKANSASKVMKLRNSINFDFSATSHFIVAKTVFGGSTNSVFNELRDLAESIVSGGSEVKIDYLVTTPKNINLRLTNKYGDVYADDIQGDIQIIVSNGGLKANDISGNVSIDLAFGDGYVNKIDQGRLTLSYANFSLKEAGRLSLESKSSKLTIENMESLKIQSKRDKLHLGSVKTLVGESYFSDVVVSNLVEELNINSKFGHLTLDNIKRGFSFINITSELTDMDFFFERNSTFQYDITYYKDAFIRLPKDAVKAEEKAASNDLTQKLIYGHIGSAESSSKVKVIASKKAMVNLFIK